MNEIREIKRFLVKYRMVFDVSPIERAIGCSRTTLDKFVSGERKLPKKWHKPLIQYFIQLKNDMPL